MTKLTLVEPELGSKNSIADPRIPAAFKEIEKVINGELEGTNNLKAGGVTEASLSTAVQTLLNQKSSGLTVVSHSISATAVAGELAIMQGSGTTLKLPTPTSGAAVGIFCGTGATSCKLTATGAKIYGDFIGGAETITFGTLQHGTVIAEGINWLLERGEPKGRAVEAGSSTLGFYGVTPISKATVKSNPTTEELLTALANLGLVTKGP
jgi:hypothetical protein